MISGTEMREISRMSPHKEKHRNVISNITNNILKSKYINTLQRAGY